MQVFYIIDIESLIYSHFIASFHGFMASSRSYDREHFPIYGKIIKLQMTLGYAYPRVDNRVWLFTAASPLVHLMRQTKLYTDAF